MAFAKPYEVRAWLSGGAANTDPAAALGGARSTVQDTGVFYVDDGLFTLPTTLEAGIELLGFWTTDFSTTHNIGEWWDGFGNPDPLVLGYDETTGTGNTMSVAGPAGTDTDLLIENDDADAYIQHAAYVSVDYAALGSGPPESPRDVEWSSAIILDHLFTGVEPEDYIAGKTIYRCFYVRNTGTDPTPNLDMGSDIFGATLMDGLAIEVAKGSSGISGVEQTIADETTAPVGVTWSGPGSNIVFPALTTNLHHALWVRLTIPAASTASGDFDRIVIWGRDNSNPDETYSFGFEWSVILLGEITESVELSDEADGLYTPIDDISITDEAEVQRRSYGTIVDSITLTDVAALLKTGSPDIVDEVSFSDELASQGLFHEALEDAIAFADLADTAGGQREGWTLNLDTNAVSRYLWGPFTSFARFQGRHYAVTNDGVFLLEGDTDDGEEIDAFVLTGLTDLGEEFKKRIKAAYLGVRSTGDLLLKVVVDEETYIYTVQTQGMDALKRARGTVGLGLYGNYWQFGIENADGVDFELESMKILPLKPIVDGRRKD